MTILHEDSMIFFDDGLSEMSFLLLSDRCLSVLSDKYPVMGSSPLWVSQDLWVSESQLFKLG